MTALCICRYRKIGNLHLDDYITSMSGPARTTAEGMDKTPEDLELSARGTTRQTTFIFVDDPA